MNGVLATRGDHQKRAGCRCGQPVEERIWHVVEAAPRGGAEADAGSERRAVRVRCVCAALGLRKMCSGGGSRASIKRCTCGRWQASARFGNSDAGEIAPNRGQEQAATWEASLAIACRGSELSGSPRLGFSLGLVALPAACPPPHNPPTHSSSGTSPDLPHFLDAHALPFPCSTSNAPTPRLTLASPKNRPHAQQVFPAAPHPPPPPPRPPIFLLCLAALLLLPLILSPPTPSPPSTIRCPPPRRHLRS